MRPVIWVILAILVVAAIIFTVVARRGTVPTGKRKMDTEDYIRYADRTETRLEKLEERIVDLVDSGISPEAQPMMDQLNAKIQEVKTTITNLRTEPNEEKLEKVRELYREVKKMYRELGGTVIEEEEEE
ncbi:MAG: hypothetical protein ACETVX_05985 [bacterium]